MCNGALMLARTMAPYFFSKSGMENCQAFKEEMKLNPDRVFDLVMGNET